MVAIMDENKQWAVPVPGEDKQIKLMLSEAIRFTRRVCHPADIEDVRSFLAVDVTIVVRKWLLSEQNTASMKTLVLRAVVNRISKVRARRLTREKYLNAAKCEPTHMDDHTDALTVISRLPNRLRKLAVFLEGLGRPVQPSDTFDIVFACGLEVSEVAPAIEELRRIFAADDANNVNGVNGLNH